MRVLRQQADNIRSEALGKQHEAKVTPTPTERVNEWLPTVHIVISSFKSYLVGNLSQGIALTPGGSILTGLFYAFLADSGNISYLNDCAKPGTRPTSVFMACENYGCSRRLGDLTSISIQQLICLFTDGTGF